MNASLHIALLAAASIGFVFSVSIDTNKTMELKVHDVELPDSPVGHLELPACKNITLQQGEFTISDDGSTLTANVIIRVPAVINQFRLSEGNTTADVCYPLSPQLLQCPLRKLNGSNYTPQLERNLLNRWTNETIGFRDYYTSPESVDIFACIGTVNEKRILRCNYINYNVEEYRFIDNGRRLWLLQKNTTIYRPEYKDIGNGKLSVCHPFSLAFTSCSHWGLNLHEYRIQPDHTLLNKAHDHTVYDAGDYYIRPDSLAVVCNHMSDKALSHSYYIHSVLFLVSAVCLFVAFIIHLLVPSLNYHARPLLCHMICMAVMYTALAIRKFLPKIDPAICYTLFVATYYSAMASFFWINVLSFDLWNTFANLKTTSSWLSCSCPCNVKRLFYYYSAYAFGVPLLLCITAIVVDNNPELQEALHLHPDIPGMCWFNEKPTNTVFFYIPMITVLVINLALFVSTVFNLRQASRGVEMVNRKRNTQLLIVCFKLFITMGLCRIAEAITRMLNAEIKAYIVPDAINGAQGIIIFLIYICKPATYHMLRNKLCSKKGFDGNTSKDNSQKTSSSRVSMNDRDNSVRSNNSNSVKTLADKDSSSLKNKRSNLSDRTHTDSSNSQLSSTTNI